MKMEKVKNYKFIFANNILLACRRAGAGLNRKFTFNNTKVIFFLSSRYPEEKAAAASSSTPETEDEGDNADPSGTYWHKSNKGPDLEQIGNNPGYWILGLQPDNEERR